MNHQISEGKLALYQKFDKKSGEMISELCLITEDPTPGNRGKIEVAMYSDDWDDFEIDSIPVYMDDLSFNVDEITKFVIMYDIADNGEEDETYD